MLSHRTYVHGALDAFSEFSKIIIVYFLLINLTTNKRRLRATVWILILCTTYLAIQGILLSRGMGIGGITAYKGNRVQSKGIFADPNDLAMILTIGLPFIFYFFFSERSALRKLLLFVFSGLIIYSILLTGSRGGMIALAVVVYLLLQSKSGKIVAMVLTLACFVGLMIMAPSYVVERIRGISLSEGTGYGRIEGWHYWWGMFLSNPILGIGMNNYGEYTNAAAHNSFVHVAGETGMIGLITWIGLFYFSFKNLVTIERKAGKAKRISSALGSFLVVGDPTFDQTMTNSLKVSLIGFIVCAFSLSRQYVYVPYILIALSVCTSNVSEIQRNEARISIKDAIMIAGIASAFIALWFTIARTFI